MSYYNNWDDQDDWNNEQARHHEMDRQLKEERYFDECWDLHTGLTDHIYDNCIPILQNSRFEHFYELCDEFRSPHLWNKVHGEWKLRHNVNRTGTDD